VSHPVEDLAPFVDGSLNPAERDAIVEHLSGCAACRDDVEAAARAREALRSLPTIEAPDLVAAFTPDQVRRHRGARAGAASRWPRVVPALAAAAVVALVAIAIPRLGDSSDDAESAASGALETGADAGGAVAGLRLRIEDVDYDAASLEFAAVAFGAARGSAGAEDQGAPQEAATGTPGRQPTFAGADETARAVSCLEEAFPGFPGTIVEVRRARFDGTPAYLGFVVEPATDDASAETVSVWVGAVRDCSILSIQSAPA
jgi:Putative zinc-finger